MGESALALETPESGPRRADEARLRALVAAHYDFVWRSLRRLGVAESNVEDGAQQVFLVAARKIHEVAAAGEKGFLFAIAVRVAAGDRRTRRRHPDIASAEALPDVPDGMPPPDELLDRHKARAVLDLLVDSLPMDLRAVFVLFEMEELSTTEIAALLDVPHGTIASRLRRSRELFEAAVSRYRARAAHKGGTP